MLQRVVAVLLSPLLRLVFRWIDVDDPWRRDDAVIPLLVFGSAGARRDVGWYFEGETKVRVRAFDDIQEFLDTCEYATDMHVFQEPDFWQHPRTFEQIRRGDCEDFALWAWRHLLDLGYDADFVVGRCVQARTTAPSLPGGHAWIVFRRDGQAYVYEPTCRDRMQAVQPLERVRDQYIPMSGIGPNRKPFLFAGYVVVMRQRLSGAPMPSVCQPTSGCR